MNKRILSIIARTLLNICLAACLPQSSHAADSAPIDPAQAATARVKQDVSTFTEWNQNELSLSKDIMQLLAPLKLVSLSPRGAKQPKILVAVAADGKTYRFTNDPDLAAIIDTHGTQIVSWPRCRCLCPATGYAPQFSSRGEGDREQRGIGACSRKHCAAQGHKRK